MLNIEARFVVFFLGGGSHALKVAKASQHENKMLQGVAAELRCVWHMTFRGLGSEDLVQVIEPELVCESQWSLKKWGLPCMLK